MTTEEAISEIKEIVLKHVWDEFTKKVDKLSVSDQIKVIEMLREIRTLKDIKDDESIQAKLRELRELVGMEMIV